MPAPPAGQHHTTHLGRHKASKGIALALGGGAALGWAHIGIVKVLAERGVRIDAVAGTSIGAVVAACVAANHLDVLESIARSANGMTVLRYLDVSFRGGMLGGKVIERELNRYFKGLALDGLIMPCAICAADLLTGEEVTLTKGSVVEAIRASLAIPGIFTPVKKDGRLLADGGVLRNIPVQAARRLGRDAPVVAVNLQGDYRQRAVAAGLHAEPKTRGPKAVSVTRSSIGLLLATLSSAQLALDPPDLEIAPKVGHIDVGDFTKADELIKLGRDAAEDAWPRLAALVTPHPDVPKK
jgi:NTE family protein